MPELPEIVNLASQMDRELAGKVIAEVAVIQPKCLNMPVEDFQQAVIGKSITGSRLKGKWLVNQLSDGWLLIGLGMGGEVLYHVSKQSIPEKHQVLLTFQDSSVLSLTFWWFGYVHYADALADHPMVAKLGPHFMDLSLTEFRGLLSGRRGAIKLFLLNQHRVAGIGNVYIQDPLFKAGIHPLRKIASLAEGEIEMLWRALRETMQESIDLGGSQWEQDLYGQHGRWDSSFFKVAYREGQLCPACGAPVQKIKTGSTSSFICPTCQPLAKEPPR